MSFFLICSFIVLVFMRPQEWLFEFLWGFPLLALVFAAAMVGFVLELNERKVRIPWRSPQLWLIVGLWFAMCMSHIAHTYLGGLISILPLVSKSTFFTIILLCSLDRAERLRKIAFILVMMTSVMAYNCYLQQTTGWGLADSWPIYVKPPGEDGYFRTMFFGIFGDPNDTAQILLCSIPFVFAIPRRMGIFKFLACCAVAGALIWAVTTTHSRGGQLGMIVMGSLLAASFLPPWLKRWVLWGLLAGYMFMCPFSASHLDDSAHERIVFWGQANWVFKSTPLRALFGVGANMFSDYIEDSRAAHNSFVLCYTELGIFGFWFWYGLIQVGIVGAMRSAAALQRPRTLEERWMKRFASLAVASIGGYMAAAYFLSRAFIYPTLMLFAMLAAIPIVTQRLLPEDHPVLLNPRKDLLLWNTLGALGCIFYIYFSIILLNRAYAGG